MDGLILVDTSAWICFFDRKGFTDLKESIKTLLDEGRVAVAGPILVELLQGARTLREKQSLERNIRGLHWLRIEDGHWQKAADLSFALRRKGITISAVDGLIAAVAISYRCQLLHRDSDFERIAGYTNLKLFE